MLWAALAVTIAITARRRGYQPERETARHRARDRARLMGRHLGDPVSDHPAGGIALRHLHAIGDRRLRGDLCGGGGILRLPHADAGEFSRSRRRQPGGCRRRDVPARAVGDLWLRHRVRTDTRGDLGLDAGPHRQRPCRDGDDRALHPDRRHLHGRLGADHHADADLPSPGDEVRHRSRSFRARLHHRRHHRKLHAAGRRCDVRRLPGAALSDQRVHEGTRCRS